MNFGGSIQESESNLALIAFLGSLVFHVLLFFILGQIDSQTFVSKQDEEIEVFFRDEKKQNYFVDSKQLQDEPKEKPKKEVQFKSNQTQRTEIETWRRPERQSPIQANLNSGGGQGQNKDQKEDRPQEQEKQLQDSDFSTQAQRKPLDLPGFAGSNAPPMIPAFVQEQLPPGVRLGNVTALNTDQHRFYSFNQRLLARFIPLWGSKVRRSLYQWLKENNPPPISKTWVTNVEVIMDKNGEIIDVQPFRLSDSWAIDSASIDAFKGIKNVPNPPAEMVDENGYIHMQFQTEVLWIPQPGVRYHGSDP